MQEGQVIICRLLTAGTVQMDKDAVYARAVAEQQYSTAKARLRWATQAQNEVASRTINGDIDAVEAELDAWRAEVHAATIACKEAFAKVIAAGPK